MLQWGRANRRSVQQLPQIRENEILYEPSPHVDPCVVLRGLDALDRDAFGAWLLIAAPRLSVGECVAAARQSAEAGRQLSMLRCPHCGNAHLDHIPFATRVHRKHLCQQCKVLWRYDAGPVQGNPIAAWLVASVDYRRSFRPANPSRQSRPEPDLCAASAEPETRLVQCQLTVSNGRVRVLLHCIPNAASDGPTSRVLQGDPVVCMGSVGREVKETRVPGESVERAGAGTEGIGRKGYDAGAVSARGRQAHAPERAVGIGGIGSGGTGQGIGGVSVVARQARALEGECGCSGGTAGSGGAVQRGVGDTAEARVLVDNGGLYVEGLNAVAGVSGVASAVEPSPECGSSDPSRAATVQRSLSPETSRGAESSAKGRGNVTAEAGGAVDNGGLCGSNPVDVAGVSGVASAVNSRPVP